MAAVAFGDAWKLHNLPWELMFDRSSGSPSPSQTEPPCFGMRI